MARGLWHVRADTARRGLFSTSHKLQATRFLGGIMRDATVWLAVACVVAVGVYAFLYPGRESMEMLKEVTIGVLVGKYALAMPPTNGK